MNRVRRLSPITLAASKQKEHAMNRRHALAGLAGAAGGALLSGGAARAEQPKAPIPGAIKLSLGDEVTIGAQSSPIKLDKTDLHILSVGKGTFRLDKESRLTAKLKAAVAQYAKIEYWLSAAVFDAAGKLLGTAAHKEAVDYVRLGAMPTMFRDIPLDFGISTTFKNAAFVVVAISDRDVPKPG
jgi:hypothetical protein